MSQITRVFHPNGLIATITGDAGGALSPDGAGNIDILGGTGIDTSGAGNVLTITASAVVATSYLTDDANTAVPALNVLTVAGGTNIGTTSAGSTVTINLDDTITLNTVNATTFDTNVAAAGLTLSGTSLIADGTDADIDINITAKGSGQVIVDDLNISGLTAGTLRSSATGDISSLADGGDGTLLIGSTAGTPVWATLTDGNNITATEGANSITLDLTGTTEHALQVGSAAGALTSLGVGSTGQILQGNTAADPSWSTATYPSTSTQGDVFYSSADNVISTLAKDATATRYLSNTGASNNPAWAQVDLTNGVTGTLPAANGGTGAGTLTDHGLLVGSGTSPIDALAVGVTGETLMGSTGADPGWTGSPSFSGSVTAGTGLTVTANDVTVSSGNLNIPLTSASSGQLVVNGDRLLHFYGNSTDYNTFIGKTCGNLTLTTGTAKYNNGWGINALLRLTTGNRNLAIGASSMTFLTSGTYNSGLGNNTLDELVSGSYNLALGYNSGSAYTTSESSNICISNIGVVGESNTIRIGTQGTGNTQQDTTYIAGIYGVTPAGTLNVAYVDSNGQLGSVATLGVANGGTGAATLTDHGVLLGSGTGAVTATSVGASGEILQGNTGNDPFFTATPLVTTMYATTFDTNVAAAGVTLSGTTLSADGTDTNIDINITAKGTGQVIIDDLQLTTDLAVTEGGTGASTFTDNGVLYGNGTSAIAATAEGASGEVLIGSTGNPPAWLAAGTSSYVLTSNGSGSAPSWQAASGGSLTLNAQTGTTYTLVLSDVGKLVTLTNAAAITLTVPPNSSVAFSTGDQILLYQGGAGTVTVSPGSGVTIRSSDSELDTYAQYSMIGLTKIDTDTWVLTGDKA